MLFRPKNVEGAAREYNTVSLFTISKYASANLKDSELGIVKKRKEW